jgi:hypothetical protein
MEPGTPRAASAGRYRQAHGVLVEAEPGGHHRPGPVVEEGEQIRLAPAEVWTVQGVTDPQLVAPIGLEPAEHRRRGRAVTAVVTAEAVLQGQTLEVALQGSFRGRPPGLGAQDPGDLGGGAGRVLPFQRRRHLQHLGRGARSDSGRARHQRLEPATAPVPGPAVDGVARDPHRRPERAGVLALGQRPHQPAPRPGRERRVDHLLDQLVTEQPDPPGPLGPPPGVVVDLGHLLPPAHG